MRLEDALRTGFTLPDRESSSHIIREECWLCEGSGRLSITEENMNSWRYDADSVPLNDLMNIILYWAEHHFAEGVEMICPVCRGEGEVNRLEY